MQTLIIDADDTLWENNIHFEQAVEAFFDLLEISEEEKPEAQRALDEVERKNIPVHGYGSACFSLSLADTLESLKGRKPFPGELQRIEILSQEILEMPIDYLPGVQQTLTVLRSRYRLLLFTKGHLEEQRSKVDRSGAHEYFHHIEVTAEKDPDDYRRIIDFHEIDISRSWMVGNSPRSDINPALAVGLGAVFIPHARTWQLEHQDVREPDHDRFHIVRRFEDLLHIDF